MELQDTSRSVDDRPTTVDRLAFTPYVNALAGLIAAEGTRTPLTIGVFGPWGSGKTSLMMMVKERLSGFTTVWFEAWKYEREDALWRALIVQVLRHLRREEVDGASGERTEEQRKADEKLDDLEASLYRIVEREEAGELRIDWGKLGVGMGKVALHLALSAVPVVRALLPKLGNKSQEELGSEDLGKLFDAVKRERHRIYREHVRSVEQFQGEFRKLVRERVIEQGRRLVVFVDDLDRCMPEKAVEVLEAIKLFLDVEGCIFVLGLDRKVISRGIEIRYREMKLLDDGDGERFAIEGRRYLEKIIQIPFKIPPVDPNVKQTYVSSLVDAWPHRECSKVFATGTGESPRGIKRMVNTFLLLWQIQKERKLEGITPVRLAKVVALQHLAPPGLYEELEKQPRLLGDLESYYRRETGRGHEEPGRAEAVAGAAVGALPPVLRPFVSRAALRQLLTLHGLDKPDFNFVVQKGEDVVGLKHGELQPYFTLAQQVSDPAAPDEGAHALLPEPETVPVPEGTFKMGTSPEEARIAIEEFGVKKEWIENEQPQHEVFLSDYAIGKYPVTNREYQAFVVDTDRQPPSHWDGAEYPEGKGGHPVVHVSWEDATAYCAWLRKKTGKDYELPTEAQWEKAARGTDARIFPWGNTWDPERLNSGEKGPGDTTPVGTYSPEGDSPCGAADMAGNVWEWCRDWYSPSVYEDRAGQEVRDPEGPESGGTRVMRGGAFRGSGGDVRCAFRLNPSPGDRGGGLGFRVVVLPFSEL
jgi:formylglycine-generating enzyme required for sulfatase activity